MINFRNWFNIIVLSLVMINITGCSGGTDPVVPVGKPPIAFAVADPVLQVVGGSVNFSDSGSYDPDGGTITLGE